MQIGGNSTLENSNLIPTVWSKTFFAELRNKLLLGDLFSRDYEGEIKAQGNTVKVNQILSANGEILTDDKQKYNTEKMGVNQFTMTADKRVSAGFKFTDLAALQSQSFEEDAKAALSYGVMKSLEVYLINQAIAALDAAKVAPIAGAGNALAKADITKARTALAKNLVPFDGNVFAAYGADYYGNLLDSSTLTSWDFVDGRPLMSQQLPNIYGIKHFEHILVGNTKALFFHRTLLNLVMQQELRIKVSDLHAAGEYGYVMTADLVFGSAVWDAKRGQMING